MLYRATPGVITSRNYGDFRGSVAVPSGERHDPLVEFPLGHGAIEHPEPDAQGSLLAFGVGVHGRRDLRPDDLLDPGCGRGLSR